MCEMQGLVWKVIYSYNMRYKEYVGFYICTTALELKLFLTLTS